MAGEKNPEIMLGEISVKDGKIGRAGLLKMVKEKYRIKIGVLSVSVTNEKIWRNVL